MSFASAFDAFFFTKEKEKTVFPMFYCGWKGSRVAQSTSGVVFVPVHMYNAQGCKPLSSSALETPGAARGRWLWLTLFPGLLHLLSLEDHPLKKRDAKGILAREISRAR